MKKGYREINVNDWKRKVHCEVFRNSVEPQYCVSYEVDITNYRKQLKQKGYSFTLAMIYAVTKCANEIEEFRYRFVEGKVVLFDRINTAFTCLHEDTELFKVVNVEMPDSMEEYLVLAEKTQREQKEFFTGPLGNNVFQFSPLPWISFTHVSHTISGKKDNATPLFDWGKFFEREGKTLLPFSVQVHHSFVDGVHIGKFAEKLQNFLDNFQ